MTTDVIVRPEPSPLALQLADQNKLALLWETIAPNLYPAEQELFVEICTNTGLNPFMKQIYAIPRGTGDRRKVTFQVAIDGFRLIAHRTGLHAGTDDAVFEEDANGKPKKATVTVWKLVNGQRFPFTASAIFREYSVDADKSWSQWAIRPHTMIAKCAEGLALRKAFPAEMSGIYTEDEMAQADNPAYDAPQPVSEARREARQSLATNGSAAESKAQQREQVKRQPLADDGLPPRLGDVAYAKNRANQEGPPQEPAAEWFEPLKGVLLDNGKKLSELSAVLERPASAKALRDWAATLPDDIDPYGEMLRRCRELGILPKPRQESLSEWAPVEAVDPETGEVITVDGDVLPAGFEPVAAEEDVVFE